MALRRDDNHDKQLNRAGSGRSRVRGAGLYDLRNSDPERTVSTWTGQPAELYTFGDEQAAAGRNRPSGGSPGAYGRTDAEERPYRERHRVEVKETERTRNRGVVRGNAPAERREAAEPGERREISADIFVPNRPVRRITRRSPAGTDGSAYGSTAGRGGSSRTSTGRSIPENGYAQSADTRRGAAGRSQEYARPIDTGRGTADRSREYAQSADTRRGAAGRSQEYARPIDVRRGTSSRERDYGQPFTQDPYYRPDEEEWEDQFPDETEEKERRARQRARIRKQREKELRITYMKIGTAAFVLLFIAAFLISSAVRRLPLFSGDHGTEASREADDSEGILAASGGEESPDDELSGQKEDASEPDNAAGRDQEAKADSPADEGGAAEDSVGNDGKTADAQERDAQAEQGEEEPEQAAEESPQQEGPEEAAGTGSQDEDLLILVNPWHTIPEGYEVETSSLLNGESVDSRCYSELAAMLQDCLAAGGSPIVCSAYRPHEKQVKLYQDQVDSLLAKGKTREEAEAEAGTVVAVPGTSEHELGLAVDICDSENQNLDETQAETTTQKWLMEHCWEYGFILRYPVDKSEITGIIYEPWHYRYVGREAAAQIHESGLCLEEYLGET